MEIDPGIFWPEYRKEHKDHFHALGLIIAAFNHAEFAFYVLFQRLLKLHDGPGSCQSCTGDIRTGEI
jgi:hypothetical protein